MGGRRQRRQGVLATAVSRGAPPPLQCTSGGATCTWAARWPPQAPQLAATASLLAHRPVGAPLPSLEAVLRGAGRHGGGNGCCDHHGVWLRASGSELGASVAVAVQCGDATVQCA